MTTLDLASPPGAAPRRKRITRHAAMELRLVLRNGEQLLLALAIPIGLILAHAAFGERLGIPIGTFIPGVLALGLWSTGFTSLAIMTGFERRYGVLERLAATPLRRWDLVAGKALATTVLALGQAAVLCLTALAVGWRPTPTAVQWLVAACVTTLSLASFAGLALCLAGTSSAELTLAAANLIYLLGAASGLMLPLANYPSWSQPLLALLPTTALAESLRDWSTGAVAPVWILVSAAWAIASLLLARKVFRWTS